MLHDCHRYSNAINAKGEPFPAEASLMTLVFIQHKMISWLIKYQYKKLNNLTFYYLEKDKYIIIILQIRYSNFNLE
jgi:hypothetical protein